MSEKKEIYADGIGQIHFAGGMVRYDFVTLQPKEDGMAPESQSNIRIIMPPQGFLAAFNSRLRFSSSWNDNAFRFLSHS